MRCLLAHFITVVVALSLSLSFSLSLSLSLSPWSFETANCSIYFLLPPVIARSRKKGTKQKKKKNPQRWFYIQYCFLLLLKDDPSQPPTVACKSGNSVGTCTRCIRVFFLPRLAPICSARWVLVNKISEPELRRKLIKSALLVGLQDRRHRNFFLPLLIQSSFCNLSCYSIYTGR